MPTLLRRTLEAKARRGVEELSAQLLGSLESPSESVRLVQLIKNQAIGSARHKRWFIECQIVPVLVSLLEYDQAATTAATATASSSLEQQQPQQQQTSGEWVEGHAMADTAYVSGLDPSARQYQFDDMLTRWRNN